VIKIISLILVLLPVVLRGQENLVPNGDFESHSDFPGSGPYLVPIANPWFTTGVVCSPDYFSIDCPPLVFPPDTLLTCGVPANDRGFQSARSGTGYAGFFAYSRFQTNGREFVQIELVSPIVQSVKYRLSFYVSLADDYLYAVRTLGAFFSDSIVTRESYQISGLNIVPQIVNSSPLPLDNKNDWVEVTDTFSSRYGGERFLVIGNFMLDNESDTVFVGTGILRHAYYYLDDVSVVALDSVPSGVGEEERLAFSMYPNPATDAISFTLGTASIAVREVRVWDAVGREVLYEGSMQQRVNISHLPQGLYMVQLTATNGHSAVQPLVISRQ
jgi:hypothetical protein